MSTISDLVEQSPYTEATVTALEAHLAAQFRGQQQYTFEANKCLMKNYQLKPETAKLDVIGTLLLLSAMQLAQAEGKTDFLSLSYILPVMYKPEKCPKTKYISTLVKTLEQGQFKEFWALKAQAASVQGGASAAGGETESVTAIEFPAAFEDNIRKFILNNIKSTYKSLPVQTFSLLLNMPQEAALKMVRDDKRSLSADGDKINIVSDNQPVAIEAVSSLKSDVILQIAKM